MLPTPQRKHGGDADRFGVVLGQRFDLRGLGYPDEAHDQSMPHPAVLVVVLANRCDKCRSRIERPQLCDSNGGQGTNTRAGIRQQADDFRKGGSLAEFAKDFCGLAAHCGIGIAQQRSKQTPGGVPGHAAVPRDLAKAPDSMETRELVGVPGHRFVEGGPTGGTVGGQSPLSLQPDSLIAVSEELGEFLDGLLREIPREQFPGFADDRLVQGRFIGDAVDAALARLLPAFHPVGDERAAAGSEVDVGGEDAPEELLVVGHAEARAARLHPEAAHSVWEIAHEEVPVILGRHAGPRIPRDTRRSAAHMADGRQNVGGGVRLGVPPKALCVPRAKLRRVLPLPTDAPSAVAAGQDVDPAGLVAAVGVVVAGPEVALVVEGEFLRIAQAHGHDLDVRAVGFAAEDRAGVGDEVLQRLTRKEPRSEVRPPRRATIGDRPIDTAIGSELQPVHVMATEGDVDAETGGHLLLADLGLRPDGSDVDRFLRSE